jgi:hypothetical protein
VNLCDKTVLPALLLFATTIAAGACAALQPPDIAGPRANAQPYPLLFTEDPQRREAAFVAASQLLGTTGSAQSQIRLHPVTATIESLPQNQSAVYLPKVGAGATMNEEEVRESLRRFLRDWRNLIGANPTQLSLVQRTDQPDGTKLALYEQRPFRYPLRGHYGKLEIRFDSQRRLVNLSSSCLPDSERLQTSLSNFTPQISAEDAIKLVQNSGVSYTKQSGAQQTVKPSNSTQLGTADLVVYVAPVKTTNSLELRLAYEIKVPDLPSRTVYVDAVNSEIIAAIE